MFYVLALNCEDIGFLKMVLFAKNIISILQIVIPILLIASLMLDAFKNVTDKEGWNKKIITKMAFKIMAAICVYLAPALVNIVLSILQMRPFQENACFKNATKEYISGIQEETGETTDLTDILSKIEAQLQKRWDLQEQLGGKE